MIEDARDAIIDELREELLQLRKMIAPPTVLFPSRLGLSATEDSLLKFLFTAPGGFRSWDSLCQFMELIASYKHELADARNEVNIYLVSMRKKLRPQGLDIHTRYKMGLEFRLEHRKLLAEMVCAEIHDFDWQKEIAVA